MMASFETNAATAATSGPSQSASNMQTAQGTLPDEAVMPPAETFDILPSLHELINRLIPPVPGAPATPGTKPDYPAQQPLEIHQLAGEVSSVRARIRRARRVVESLPDSDRTVEEQEAEMAALRERIGKQKAVLAGLKEH